jgi:hypothetical protein
MNMDLVNTFLVERSIDISMFKDGITAETLRFFEEISKIGINIFYIDERGPEYTKHYYVSIYIIKSMSLLSILDS